MEIFLWAVAAALLAQLLFVLWNTQQLPKLVRAGSDLSAPVDGARPLLSILVPARNEADNIAACIHSALAQTLPSEAFEIIVLDDRSEDNTATLVRQLAEQHSAVRLLAGRPLPSGWVGKCYACHQLSQAAKGQAWLFIDADARLEQGAAQQAIAAMQQQRTGLITGFPRQVTGSWLERLVVPMMGFTIGCHLPIRLVQGSSDARFVAAHGAWMLVEPEAYRRIGGHAAIRGELVDDMALARAMKRAGFPVALADVQDAIYMRMYHNAGQVWAGYKKNMFDGLGRSIPLLFAVLGSYALLYVLPAVCLLFALVMPALFVPALVGYALGVLIKRLTDRMQRQPVWLSLLLPISIAAIIAIGLASCLAALRGKGYQWKGRAYR